MATKVNIVIDQGTDFATTVNLTDADGNELDVTGYSAAGQIRKSYTSSTATDFTVFISVQSSSLTLSLNNATTSAMTAGRYVYDVELTDTSNVVSRILEGQVTVTPEVTR
jgi:hypothetical protein